MVQIRALGHIPRKHKDEYMLAQRLGSAKSRRLLSETQLAELAELPAYNWREVRTAQRMETLMADIRALGHIPRDRKTRRQGPDVVETALAHRLNHAKRKSQLSESQLAELAELPASEAREVRAAERMETLMAEIRALGHIPRDRDGNALYQRWRKAQARRQLCESQLVELAEIARCSVKPLRKRPRVQDD